MIEFIKYKKYIYRLGLNEVLICSFLDGWQCHENARR